MLEVLENHQRSGPFCICVCVYVWGGEGVGEEENPASPQTMFDKLYLTLSALASLINIHLLLTISVQNQLFCCENMGIDHTLQAIQYEKLNPPKLKKESIDTI